MRAHHGSSGSGSSMSMLDPNWKLNIASGTTPLRRSGRSSSSSSSLFSMVMNSLVGRSRGVMCLVIVVFMVVFRYWLYGSSHSFGVSAARGAFVNERKFVVLDAGSSGTRIHVFTFKKATPSTSAAAFHRKSTRGAGNGHTDDGAEALVANVELQLPAPSKKQKPGLSSFVGRPADAAATLRPLLQFAEVHVAPAERATTPVALFATAGLRAVQSDEAENILQACAEVLGRSGFAVPATVGTWSTSGGASIIPGELEGRWSWLAARYAASRAGAPAPTSKGVGSRAQLAATSASRVTDAGGFLGLVEMGGASTQVVYPIADSAAVKAPRVDPLDKSHGAFVRSYLGLGLEMAQAAAAKVQAAAAAKRDACTPPGYSGEDRPAPLASLPASGNFTLCVAHAALPALRLDEGCGASGVKGLRCGVHGDPTPDVSRALNGKRPWAVLLTENMYYLADFFELPADARYDFFFSLLVSVLFSRLETAKFLARRGLVAAGLMRLKCKMAGKSNPARRTEASTFCLAIASSSFATR